MFIGREGEREKKLNSLPVKGICMHSSVSLVKASTIAIILASMYIYKRKKIMKPDVYTSTKMEDLIKDEKKTFFNLKIEMFKCSNSSKKIIIAFYLFFLSYWWYS